MKASGQVPRSRPTLRVADLLTDAALRVRLHALAGRAGLQRELDHARIQKSGLALAGHAHGIVRTRVQILGQTELSFLHGLSPDERARALRGFFGLGLSCVIATRGVADDGGSTWNDLATALPELPRVADELGAPLLVSSERSSATIAALHAYLDDRLAPRVRLHGVLVDVFGVGLLLVGASGIGKSECAIDLVLRGHRLVADDAVDCDYRPPGMVFGAAPELLRHKAEVRGLGILDVRELFGITATRDRKRIDVVCRLVEWHEATELDRLGLDDRTVDILGVAVRELVIPVRPGRDIASIVEVAARGELVRASGQHASRELLDFLDARAARPHAPSPEAESAVPPPVRSPR
jgi:HPr kinase/phosphorylase